MSDAYQTQNYPPPGDSTSSGGYGSHDAFSKSAQRGRTDFSKDSSETGLLDQSVNGGPVGQELGDAKQGSDELSRKHFRHEAERDFDRSNRSAGLNPYGQNPDTREEVGEMLASRYADARGKHYDSGAAGGNDADVGA